MANSTLGLSRDVTPNDSTVLGEFNDAERVNRQRAV